MEIKTHGSIHSVSSSSNDSVLATLNEIVEEMKEKEDVVPSLQDRLHEELKRRVSLTNTKRIHSVAYVTPLSSTEEVQFWLSSKGFTAKTQQKFQNMGGDELFGMGKLEMEKELGVEEDKIRTNIANSDGIIVLSDFRSAVEATTEGKLGLSQEINSLLFSTGALSKSCILQWIPTDVDIEGNEVWPIPLPVKPEHLSL
ncbi:SAM_3 domain-containing protein [Trichonephila clavipes]|nr:SAM_3 domain-containing protein [Trichonephila clavipes]